MSLCINNDLIWVSVPKCASFSIEKALINSNLKIKLYSKYENFLEKRKNWPSKFKHSHYRIDDMYNEFGILETFCVTRNSTERFVSAIRHLFWTYENEYKLNTKIKTKDLNNKFITDNINSEFITNLNSNEFENNIKCFDIFIYDNIKKILNNEKLLLLCKTLWLMKPQNYWTNNNQITYKFDIKELNMIKNFIFDRYNVKIKIPHINKSQKKDFIIINNELKSHIEPLLSRDFTTKKVLI